MANLIHTKSTLGDNYQGVQIATVNGGFHAASVRPVTPPVPSSSVPFRRDPHYVERRGLTEQIKTKLSVPGGRVALVGLGGAGKSQLSISYARQLHQQSPQTWVHWIHASSATRFDQDLRAVAARLKIPRGDNSEAHYLQKVENFLEDRGKGPWLVILDNADDVGFLLEKPEKSEEIPLPKRRIDYFPASDHGSMIMTSRSEHQALGSQLVDAADVVRVSPMSENEAIALMQSRLGRADEGIPELVRALDCLPLAITQASAHMRARGVHFSVQHYRQRLESLLRESVPLPNRDKEANNSALFTWRVTFEHINKIQQSAADLLARMSFCERTAIPAILIGTDGDHVGSDSEDASHGENDSQSEHSFENEPSPQDYYLRGCNSQSDGALEYVSKGNAQVDYTPSFEQDIITLRDYSFIGETETSETWQMHRLVQKATQEWLKDVGKFNDAHYRFIRHLRRSCPPDDIEGWPLWSIVFPHAKYALHQQPAGLDSRLEWASTMVEAAKYAAEQADFSGQAEMATAAMKVNIEQLGEEDETTAASMKILGDAYGFLGRWSDAERLLGKASHIMNALLGAEHPATLSAKSSLAGLFWTQDRLSEAEQLELQVLKTRRTVLGSTHPKTLRSISLLALIYSSLGRADEAELLAIELIETAKATLGAEHSDILQYKTDLMVIYLKQERWKEAEDLGVQLIETQRAVLGFQHLSTLSSMSQLASSYYHQGRFREAEQWEREVVESLNAALGANHYTTLRMTRSLACTCEAQGRFLEAEGLLVSAVNGLEKVFGPDHRDTVEAVEILERVRLKRCQQADVPSRESDFGVQVQSSSMRRRDSDASLRNESTSRSRWQRFKQRLSKVSKGS